MIFWMIVLGILAVGVGVVVVVAKSESKSDENIADTADWVETEATVESAAIERLDKYRWLPGFAFSYSVKHEYFAGKFFLKTDQEQSEELTRTLLNKKFPVQYDPNDPSAWFIAENTIAGFEIIQELSIDYPPETGLYRTYGDTSIDLHINR